MQHLLNVAIKPWFRLGAAAWTILSLVLDIMGVGDFPWQWVALGGFVVFFVTASVTIALRERELDRRSEYQRIADGLSEHLAEGDRLMGTLADGVFSIGLDDAQKWVGRTAAFIKENCTKSDVEGFLVIDYTKKRAKWRSEHGKSLAPEQDNAQTQVSARMNNLRRLLEQYQRAAKGLGGD